MRTEPTLDLSTVDLDRVVVSREQIYEVMPHRFEMALLDRIVHLDLEQGVAVGVKEAREDEFWVRGHIPGRPLLPGVLMVEAAGQLSGYVFEQLMPGEEGRFFGFAALDNVRFKGVVVPGDTLVLVAKRRSVKKIFGAFDVQGYVGDRMVLEVTIKGMVIPSAAR